MSSSAGKQLTVNVDFDGVVHSYTSGWEGATIIGDPPVPGSFAWLTMMTAYEDLGGNTFKVCIYSSRSAVPFAVEAMVEWFRKHELPEETLDRLVFPTLKPPAHITIDDRAYLFKGHFPNTEDIIRFQPWYKRTA